MNRTAFVTNTAGLTGLRSFRTQLSSMSPRRLAVLPRAPPNRVATIPRMQQDAAAAQASVVTTSSDGEPNTQSYRLFFRSDKGTISPWHDIPLRPDPASSAILNFVNEIPRGTQAKMEIATDEASTPIKQDIKKGALRFYQYGPSLINYGAAPQTWEDPGSLNPELNVCGDGDPVDICEIGSEIMPFGAVYTVKVLGCLALLDEGEIDWKILAVNTNDPLADNMSDIADVDRAMPGRVDEIREWFRLYKTAEGKGENEYAYNGEAKGRDFAINVIDETHKSWSDLRSGKIANDDDLSLK